MIDVQRARYHDYFVQLGYIRWPIPICKLTSWFYRRAGRFREIEKMLAFFLWLCYDKNPPQKAKKFFTLFKKLWITGWNHEMQNSENVLISLRNVFTSPENASEKLRNEYSLENFKKIEFFWKKVLTNGVGRGIINKRSRERVKKAPRWRSRAKHFVN